ncbi:hypothetical protein ACP275_13G147300 [Erythranthe tilingii]
MSSPYEIPITVDLDRSDILLDNTANPVEVLPGEVRDDPMTSTRDVGIDEEEEEEEEEFEESDSENNTNQHYMDSTSTDDEIIFMIICWMGEGNVSHRKSRTR